MKSRNIILSLALMGCTAANALTLQQAKNYIPKENSAKLCRHSRDS